jgi:hypothetical protein
MSRRLDMRTGRSLAMLALSAVAVALISLLTGR